MGRSGCVFDGGRIHPVAFLPHLERNSVDRVRLRCQMQLVLAVVNYTTVRRPYG